VDYVVPFKTVDFASCARLGSQVDLRVVMDTAEIQVLRNESPLHGSRRAGCVEPGVSAGGAAHVPEPWSPGRSMDDGELLETSRGTMAVVGATTAPRVHVDDCRVLRLVALSDGFLAIALVLSIVVAPRVRACHRGHRR
jgi:hypothetical protein